MPTNDLKPAERHEAYSILRESGYSEIRAATTVGYSPKSHSHIATHVEPKRKRSLVNGLGTSARRALKAAIEGKAIGDAAPPKTADVLHGVEIVLDRLEPKVIKSENKSLHIGIDLTPEQLKELDLDMPATVAVLSRVYGKEVYPTKESDS